MTNVDLRCPKCNRYLASVNADMNGSVSIRLPSCPNCKAEVNQRIIATKTTAS